MPQTRSQKRKAELDARAGNECKSYIQTGKEISEATMRFALLESGVSVGDLEGISSRDLQSLYQSQIKKSKRSKSNSGVQRSHKKITYCTWDSRARRSATIPKSALQYYKMSKPELMKVLEPFDLDKECLNNTALAKLCVLYHSEIRELKDQDTRDDQPVPSCSVQSQIRNQNIAIDYDNPRNSKHLHASFQADSSSPTPNTNHQKEGSSMHVINLNTVEGSPGHSSGSEKDREKEHELLDDNFGSPDPDSRKSADKSLSEATREVDFGSPTPSTRRLSNTVPLIPSSPLLDSFAAVMNEGFENPRNEQDHSDPDDEAISDRTTTSSISRPTQPSQRNHPKNALARPKRKVRRHSRPSFTASNQTDQTPDSSPHRTTRYSKGKQPGRNGCSPPILSFITPDQSDHTPETSPHRTTRLNKGKQPARNTTYTFPSSSYIAPCPIDRNPDTSFDRSTSGRKDASDNQTYTNEHNQQHQSAPGFSTNRHCAPSATISTRMKTSIENRLLDLENKVNFLESNAGDRDVDLEALNKEVEVVRQRLDVTLRDVHISLRNARRNQGGQVNDQAQQNEGEQHNQREATPQAKKAVLRGLVRFHLKVLYGQRKGMKTMPGGATPDQRAAWLRKSMRQMLTMDLEEFDDDLHEPGNDPQFPYEGGPGNESTTPQVIKIIWLMMCGVRMASYRLNFEESINSKENTFLLEFATASFIKLVQCGEYKGVTPGDNRPEIIFNLMKLHAKDRLRRIWREQQNWTPERRQARDKRQLRVSRARTLKEDRLEVVGSHRSLWPLDPLVVQCCSDDETDEEQTVTLNSKVCKIRRYEWRSTRMNYILDKIDKYRDKKTNSSPGNTPGGNPYRKRVRSENNPLNPSAPPVQLPLDCYDRDWYDRLEQDAKDELQALPPVGLSQYTRLLKQLCSSG